MVNAVLLRMVQRGVANEGEQRAARLIGTGAPAPAVGHCPQDPTDQDPTERGKSLIADQAATRLTVRRPTATAPLQVTVGDEDEPLAYWRAAWAELPPALVDQLTTGVLTRLAADRQVTTVHSADAASAPVARAVAAGIGARYGGQP
ncbi:hypothetical protein O7623_17770 [Solwaraspora sp. WMMD791]|uniref:hypothetical protein n=1 Tax=Solwaraspora sp. WMMD791 TaxID=3016086 RepID=UPI00249BD363|nr:hypothetical protein [Solwaraspora sp. WMMD791]WFE25253.1 hypothetical protein O7623_17770 [Solwaraspora sp. WMMD791]